MNMNKAYNEPEFKAIKMASQDVLTASQLDPGSTDWDTANNDNGGTVPVISL
jgi:hypothetical protein